MDILLAIIIIVLVVVIPSIKIVPQAKSYVIERLGSYYKTWGNGLHFKVPFIDRVANVTSMKEIVKDFAPQPVITKDNVTMQIDTVVYFQITNPNLYTYGVENPISAIENLTATTLRNVIGGTLLLILTKTAIKKILPEKTKTNIDRIIGMKGIVTKDITKKNHGEVKVDGKYWTAVADEPIKSDTTVEILEINSTKLKVKRMED